MYENTQDEYDALVEVNRKKNKCIITLEAEVARLRETIAKDVDRQRRARWNRCLDVEGRVNDRIAELEAEVARLREENDQLQSGNNDAREWIGDLKRERDELRAAMERVVGSARRSASEADFLIGVARAALGEEVDRG